MPKTVCPYCRSTDTEDRLLTRGPHYARRDCRACGRFLEWLPHPREATDGVPAAIAPFVVKRDKPVSLRGTPNQVAAARSLRANMIGFASRAGAVEYVRLLACVNDANWFLANRGLFPPDLKCWPRADQMEQVKEGVTGS